MIKWGRDESDTLSVNGQQPTHLHHDMDEIKQSVGGKIRVQSCHSSIASDGSLMSVGYKITKEHWKSDQSGLGHRRSRFKGRPCTQSDITSVLLLLVCWLYRSFDFSP